MRSLLVAIGVIVAAVCAARAADTIAAKDGPIVITPVLHSTLQIEYAGRSFRSIPGAWAILH